MRKKFDYYSSNERIVPTTISRDKSKIKGTTKKVFVSFNQLLWTYHYPESSYFTSSDLKRDDPILIQVVKEMDKKANGMCAELEIIEIPDGVEWEIEEYDGIEWVSETHRTWS